MLKCFYNTFLNWGKKKFIKKYDKFLYKFIYNSNWIKNWIKRQTGNKSFTILYLYLC